MAIRAYSVSNLLRKKYKEVPFTGEFREAFGIPEANGIWLIYGESGNGKSTFAQKLAKYFDEELKKSVAYFSVEEEVGMTMQLAAQRAGWKEKGSRIKILEPATKEELDEWLNKRKSSNIIIVDTLQKWVELYNLKLKDLNDLHKQHKDRLFIYISHVKGNNPEGMIGVKMLQRAALKIYVQGFRAYSKGRTTGSKGYYSIWAEKEQDILFEN